MSSPRWKNPDRVLPRAGINVLVSLKTSIGILDAFWHREEGFEGGAFSNYSTDGERVENANQWWIAFGESHYRTEQSRNIEIFGWAYRVAK